MGKTILFLKEIKITLKGAPAHIHTIRRKRRWGGGRDKGKEDTEIEGRIKWMLTWNVKI